MPPSPTVNLARMRPRTQSLAVCRQSKMRPPSPASHPKTAPASAPQTEYPLASGRRSCKNSPAPTTCTSTPNCMSPCTLANLVSSAPKQHLRQYPACSRQSRMRSQQYQHLKQHRKATPTPACPLAPCDLAKMPTPSPAPQTAPAPPKLPFSTLPSISQITFPFVSEVQNPFSFQLSREKDIRAASKSCPTCSLGSEGPWSLEFFAPRKTEALGLLKAMRLRRVSSLAQGSVHSQTRASGKQ